ncbi:RluA family pseudouridine synthase [Leptospira bandrabouensis]|uniref:RluA family pseudouridine synthase n=1 Tax=Leptospira bandrabouensis TaxID=2484903 RepID=A0A6H3NLB2_9LEPT|nr:RluA family pseudouridine synthase [Leptospira bandrabouensis]MCG6145048.1 RluA family pseudouridine synthase [Leptospira bandrabouensis]MCG6153060.1 RluA family pseudouridine synthase [Leptospira bandrabouensis]MCG6160315.1 RluA family pseudouridine synthase [Leptospira bandrabouensis]MCG6164247.1 RluA family pseudouridine synthase [Leptospira bandrabouensis]TGN03858.1 RluA family pseudouridine synthase [Leptospira bandrabouensis]
MKSPLRQIRLKGGFTTKILFECEEFLIAEKPEGLPVHETKDPNRKDFTRLLASYLHLQDLRTVNRLDLGTSGIVLLGKTQTKNKEIDSLLKEAEKEYIFLCNGIPDWKEKRFECFIRDGNKEVQIVRSGGKKAITEFRILSHFPEEGLTFGMAKILTGRRHQIRVMLKELGFPILGDPVYSDSQSGKKETRMYLHSFRLCFTDLQGKKQWVETEIPLEFSNRVGKTLSL